MFGVHIIFKYQNTMLASVYKLNCRVEKSTSRVLFRHLFKTGRRLSLVYCSHSWDSFFILFHLTLSNSQSQPRLDIWPCLFACFDVWVVLLLAEDAELEASCCSSFSISFWCSSVTYLLYFVQFVMSHSSFSCRWQRDSIPRRASNSHSECGTLHYSSRLIGVVHL